VLKSLSYAKSEGGLKAAVGTGDSTSVSAAKSQSLSLLCDGNKDKHLWNLGLISLNKTSQCNHFTKNRTYKTSWVPVKISYYIYFSLRKKVIESVFMCVGEALL
jgi:hypothetical protein